MIWEKTMRENAADHTRPAARIRLARAPLALLLSVCLAFAAGCGSRRPGEVPQAGFNSYSKADDVEIGRQVSDQVDMEMPIVNNQQLQNYVAQLGAVLARQPQADDYPYQFKVINDPSINAFALPGGPIYLHTGIIENAANEGQVVGVLAHEISHVALRHGTNQASKAQLFNLGGVLASAALGTDSAVGQIGQLGLSLGISSVLLSYSRSAESDADALGARIMAGAGYNPVEMARFFETLERQSGGPESASFLSSHPSPGDRVRAVTAELEFLPNGPFNAGTGRFQAMQAEVERLPEPPAPRQ